MREFSTRDLKTYIPAICTYVCAHSLTHTHWFMDVIQGECMFPITFPAISLIVMGTQEELLCGMNKYTQYEL